MTDATNLIRLLQDTRPHEIYNLAAQSHVQVSFETPEYTANADALGTLRLLEAMRILALEDSKFYQASTSELYGKVARDPATRDDAVLPALALRRRQALRLLDHRQLPRGLRPLRRKRHPLQPREPTARRDLRHPQDYPRRRRHRAGLQDILYIGNLDAKRDWGHAKDFVKGMWLILQQPKPDDYVLATGESHSVREFIELAFAQVGPQHRLEREAATMKLASIATAAKFWSKSIRRYFRPTEVDVLLGDASKAQRELGWEAETSFTDLVAEMVKSDLELLAPKEDASAVY